MTDKEMKLKVAEAFSQSDVGRSIARIDPACMDKLDLKDGDTIEIEGNKLTAATVASSQSDIGLGIIRIDGYMRKNVGATIGEEVVVRHADAKEAKKVVLAPVEHPIMVQGDVRGAFAGRVLSKGDILISGFRQPQASMRGSLFDEFFRDVAPMGELKLAVVSTKPAGIVKVTAMTDVEIQQEPVDVSKLEGVKTFVDVTYEDIGGLKDEVKKVREMIEIPLKRPELFERLGISPPKGVLMHGPPGTGKTLLAKAVANESDAYFITINGPEIMSKYVGGSEERLREIFEEAEENAPSIVFIDEIDAISPKREEVTGEVERRTVAQLLTLMDGLKARGQVMVIGATNRVDALDPAIRRPGRFDREIEIGVPDKDGRKEVLQIHTRGMPMEEDVDLDEISEVTYGFVGADLESLAKEAAMRVLRRILPEIKSDEEEIPKEVLQKIIVKKSDFKEALKEIQPSALREVLVQVPDIKWDDIGGLENAKQELQEAVEWPLKYPENFEKFGVRPP
ncbi:MAG: AAA family ATPase, partial [Methanobacterium sp.]